MNREVSKLAFTLAEGASHGAMSDSNRKAAARIIRGAALCRAKQSGELFCERYYDRHLTSSADASLPLTNDTQSFVRQSRKFGFTLAEVLITLGIIGVVAAMTLPALIQNNNAKALHTALLKNYSVLQSALQKASYEQGQTITPAILSPQGLKKLLMKELNAVKDCGAQSCVSYSRGENNDGEMSDKIIKNYKTYNNKIVMTTHFDDGQFMLADGSIWMLENMINSTRIYITIDINGPNKKPNKWGHDLFTFQIVSSGKVLPMGAEGTTFTNLNQYCSSTSSIGTNGISCTHKALTDKNYFKNLP